MGGTSLTHPLSTRLVLIHNGEQEGDGQTRSQGTRIQHPTRVFFTARPAGKSHARAGRHVLTCLVMNRSRPDSPALVLCSLLLSLGLLGLSCVSARSEPALAPADRVDAGGDPGDAGAACRPRSCLQARARCGVIPDGCGGSVDCGPCAPPCAPGELDCCGICIPRSEGRCPDNIHCRPTAPPVEAEQ